MRATCAHVMQCMRVCVCGCKSNAVYAHTQDALASFGWFVLAHHHVANLAVLVLLLLGPQYLAPAAPLALLLPLAHLTVSLCALSRQ